MPLRRAGILTLAISLGVVSCDAPPPAAQAATEPAQPTLRLDDRFDEGLDRWEIIGPRGVRIIDSGDPAHGQVLELTPHGDVLALVRDSAAWGDLRLDADVLFPSDENNYLGVAWDVERRGERTDFGLVYIKGNDSYLQANPHRDFNVSRLLYPEFRTTLSGAAAIETNQWQHIRVEVSGSTCYFYVGDMTTPQMVFPLFEGTSGAIGLAPRSVGSPVWVDNVRIESISAPAYAGPPTHAIATPDPTVLTDWRVAGPFARTRDELARSPDTAAADWQPFLTDARGAVVTGRAVDYHGPETVAYFRTTIESESAGTVRLHLSTIDDLAIWVNGRFHWFLGRGSSARADFVTNPDRAGQRIPITLHAGSNDLVIRVRGGVYASGGFYAAVER